MSVPLIWVSWGYHYNHRGKDWLPIRSAQLIIFLKRKLFLPRMQIFLGFISRSCYCLLSWGQSWTMRSDSTWSWTGKKYTWQVESLWSCSAPQNIKFKASYWINKKRTSCKSLKSHLGFKAIVFWLMNLKFDEAKRLFLVRALRKRER